MGSASCYGKPFFASLWVRAWGERYPVEVEPFSSCTHELLQQLLHEGALASGATFADLGCGSGGVALWLARESESRGVGVDRKQAAIEIARRRASMERRADCQRTTQITQARNLPICHSSNLPML